MSEQDKRDHEVAMAELESNLACGCLLAIAAAIFLGVYLINAPW